ncbi:sigma-54 interaction domain-containing protein [Paraperlucidibaca wandonensis]|uniref:Sigma-54 interaction domain-containing protein n=1 Tax=Paraperlucidibaca wandonensis TaxID=1268273 RepID=A0ABW3HE87_9GAMM
MATSIALDTSTPIRTRSPLGRSSAIETVRELIRQVAPHATVVLIQGESGSGKEVVARALHDASSRQNKPFVPVNCGAIPADLLESELFGHEKGAFTGAISTRKGRFEMAEGGTLFLDEIGDMSLPMQVKLLRVLQERCFERVGSNQTIKSNVRIIAATHRDLETMVDLGSFRQDLYFRLNVFPIMVPALRERLDDLPMLLRHFCNRQIERDTTPPVFNQEIIEALSTYGWPGNIRELENLVERLSITHAGKTLRTTDLPARYYPLDLLETEMELEAARKAARQLLAEQQATQLQATPSVNKMPPMAASIDSPAQREAEQAMLFDMQSQPNDSASTAVLDLPEAGLDLKQTLQDLEIHYITEALARVDGVVSRAARLLCLQRTTLVEKMKKLGLQAFS